MKHILLTIFMFNQLITDNSTTILSVRWIKNISAKWI